MKKQEYNIANTDAPGCLTAPDGEDEALASRKAAVDGHLDVFQHMHQVEPASINHADAEGWTPIFYAVAGLAMAGAAGQEGCMGVIRFIAEVAPGIINQAAKEGYTPMQVAAGNGLADVVRIIHKVAGPESVNQTDDAKRRAPMHGAALNNHVAVIKTLLELRGDPSLVSSDGLTPLGIAQRRNQHGASDCLQGWLQMSEERRAVIITYGWDYFGMSPWQHNIHSRFPAHFRAQICAMAVSCNGELASVLGLIANGIDALKRKRPLDIQHT